MNLPITARQRVPDITVPDSKVHGVSMGPIWDRQDPGGPHVGPMNFAIWGALFDGETWTQWVCYERRLYLRRHICVGKQQTLDAIINGIWIYRCDLLKILISVCKLQIFVWWFVVVWLFDVYVLFIGALHGTVAVYFHSSNSVLCKPSPLSCPKGMVLIMLVSS